MKRSYSSETSESVSFFFGTEIEQTPAFGLPTLFVVGIQRIDDVLYHIQNHPSNIEHVYFGANQSFPHVKFDDYQSWQHWVEFIEPVLDTGILCTLDVDVSCVEGLLDTGLTERHNFIPMISVKLPYIQQLGYNATIKLDDRSFNSTNPGVWCHSLHTLQDRKNFTGWAQYSNDEVIK